jgi:molybdate transport system substrate-binding protein
MRPFLGDLQGQLQFDGAVSAGSANAEAAKALIDYLQSADALAVFKAKGVTSG